MSDIEWEDPPGGPRGGSKGGKDKSERRKAMDANPGRWLVTRRDAHSASGATYWRDIGYEANARLNPDKKTYTIYARRQVTP